MTQFRKKYDVIEVDDRCINTMMETIPQPSDMPYIEHLNQAIDMDEIRQAVMTGKRQKKPGKCRVGL
jgi:spore coat protein CotH